MRDFSVLNMSKSKEFNQVLKKVSDMLKVNVIESPDNSKIIKIVFLDSSDINIIDSLNITCHIIGVTSSPQDNDDFYKHSIFHSIPENITDFQLELQIKDKMAYHASDVIQLASKKNINFAFDDFIHYVDTLFMNSTMGIAFLLKDLKLLVFNQSFMTFFSNIYNEKPIVGKTIHDNLNMKNRSYWNDIISKCSPFKGECINIEGQWDNKKKFYQIQIIPVLKSSNQIGYAVTIKAISQFTNTNADLQKYYKYLLEQNTRIEAAYKELELSNEKLKTAYEKVNALSNHDYLTQAPNRKYFLEKIEYEQLRFNRTKTNFMLAYGDIDDFKEVNDLYGHETGDYVLISLTNVIRNTIRKIDFFCRWGGEEFLIFLAEADLKTGISIVNRILKEIRSFEFNYNGKLIKVTMTFGLAIYDKEQHINKVIDLADKKLYWGKKHNKNQVVGFIPDD